MESVISWAAGIVLVGFVTFGTAYLSFLTGEALGGKEDSE